MHDTLWTSAVVMPLWLGRILLIDRRARHDDPGTAATSLVVITADGREAGRGLPSGTQADAIAPDGIIDMASALGRGRS